MCTCTYGKLCKFGSFLALNSTRTIYEAPNLISTFDLMLIVIILSLIDWRCGWGVLCTCEREHFTCTCTYGKRCKFRSFLALNSTRTISEAPNLISTFDLMLIVIVLSFIDWRCGSGVLCTCERELYMHLWQTNGASFVAFWLSILHAPSLKLWNWSVT